MSEFVCWNNPPVNVELSLIDLSVLNIFNNIAKQSMMASELRNILYV